MMIAPIRGCLLSADAGSWREPTGVYQHRTAGMLGRKLKGKSQRELRDLGLLVEDTTTACRRYHGMTDKTIDRTTLPIRRPPFSGVTKRTLEGSEPDWNQAMHPSPPEGAPNVLLVLIDDAGFGNPSTFGGPIDTPNYTRMAEQGLRYNRFHVTAVCSPTRAAMLTGRNQHRVGFGLVAEFSGPFPGYNATIPRDCATLPRILQENGYMTAAMGKWHLTPDDQQGSSGPFNRWPNGLGFDYYWGFLGGEAGQYDPLISENNKVQGVPEGTKDEGYYFPDDLSAKTIDWLHRVRAERPATPWFVYYATGCSHAPHHVPPRVGRQVQGQVRRGLGRPARADARQAEGARRRAGRHGAGAERRVPGVGLAERDGAAPVRPPDGDVRRLLRERRLERRPRPRRDRGDGRARQHASSSGSGATTAPAWRGRSAARSTS